MTNIIKPILHFIFFLFKLFITILILFSAFTAISYYSVKHFIKGQEVDIPNLINKTPIEALADLKVLNLSLKLDKEEYNNFIEEGRIMEQYPYPSTKAKAGSTVRVSVSKGSILVKVPNVTNMSLVEAEINIRKTDLNVGTTSFMCSDKIQKNKVIAQDPPADFGFSRGKNVALLVSIGKTAQTYKMPMLKDLTLTEAGSLLSKYNLKIKKINEIKDTEKEEGLILEQSPLYGEIINSSSEIAVSVVSKY